MKRVIALIISIAMIASLATGLAVTGFAAVGDEFTSGVIKYKVTSETGTTGTVEVIANTTKYSGDITITDTVHYSETDYTVTSISARAFYGCSDLTSVTIGSGVKSIADKVFDNCSGLKMIIVDPSNTNYKSDSEGVLYSKDGTKLIICPQGKTDPLSILDSVTSIGDYAFINCTGLTSVTIGKNVTSIGDGAFNGCKNLTSINVDLSNTNYKSDNGVLYSKDGTKLIICPRGKTGSLSILDSVTSIGNEAFYGCGLTSVIIPDNVTSIGENAFRACSKLTDITIPDSVVSISDFAFGSCKKLINVTIGSGVTSIGDSAFQYCSALESVTVKATTPPSLGNLAFTDCSSLKKIYVPANSVDAYKSAPGWSAYVDEIEEIKAITINGDAIEITWTNYGISSEPIVNGDKVTVDKIRGSFGLENIEINIPKGKTLIVSTTNWNGIDAPGNIKISGGGKLIVNVLGDDLYLKAIVSNDTVTIEDCNIEVTANGNDTCGIVGRNGIIVKADLEVYEIKSLAVSSYVTAGTIRVNNITINDSNVEDYFHNNANDVSYGETLINGSFSANAITGTDFIYVSTYSAPDSEEDLDDEEENDPEVELDLGFGPVTVKTSNKSVVLNDKSIIEKMFDTAKEDTLVFDLTSTPVKLDGLFFNNDVFNVAKEANKKIEIDNRFAYAKVSTKNDIGLNPLSLHLSDVSEGPGTCATYLQKKAMNTSKVYAQINYSFVSNGKPVENDAKIYVPVDGPAKVFYLFNAEKIGIVPCEVIDGYCVFNRYFDGTYVVCATK